MTLQIPEHADAAGIAVNGPPADGTQQLAGAIVGYDDPSGYANRRTEAIIQMLIAVASMSIFPLPSRGVIAMVAAAWTDITGEEPTVGSFASEADYCSPYGGFGAEYVYRVLIAARQYRSRDVILDYFNKAGGAS